MGLKTEEVRLGFKSLGTVVGWIFKNEGGILSGSR